MVTETIAAIASAMSPSGIGIIRISGPESLDVIDRIYQSKNGKKKIKDVHTHTIHYGYIVDNSNVVDEVLVMIMHGPHTYTGEDTVEIDCHGGVLAMKKVLETVVKNGARPAEPGEFTKRAFLNGRIDLSQAEAVMDVISAKNEYALKSSLSQLKGSVQESIRDIRSKIIYHIAYIESALDDPEHISVDGYGVKLREDNVLFMLSNKLKDICNQYGVFIMSATQLNGDYKDSETPDQNLLRGAKAIGDKIDYGAILLPVKQDELTKLEPILATGIFDRPTIKISIYKNTEILVNYEPKMHYFTEWWKQLFGESEGKDQLGIFPAGVDFTTDLHSMGQYIQEGRRNLFETVIRIEKSENDLEIKEEEDNLDGLNYLAGKGLDYVNKKAMEGTVDAHVSGDVPNIIIELPNLTEETLGHLIYFFEKACAMSGMILGVNPFDQPGVEKYKKNMFKLLEKPGY